MTDVPASGYLCIFFYDGVYFIYIYCIAIQSSLHRNIRSTALLEDRQDRNMKVFNSLEKYGRCTVR